MAAGLALTASSAGAASPHSVCNDGDVLTSGVYSTLEVVGSCTVPDGAVVTVKGGMTLDPGSNFDQMSVSTLRVSGGIWVGEGATLSIGCTVIGMDCAADSVDVVNGGITAVNALTMHIDGVRVNGNFSSTGGGGWPSDPYETFAFKDNVVNGGVTISGWNGGGWMGMIRNVVSGGVTFTNNTARDYGGDDGNEITHNSVSGNLACSGNSPAAQFGDSVPPLPDPYRWNVVSGTATGECAALVQH